MSQNNISQKPLIIIPARSGSKRLKDKSLIKIDGLPMIVHTFKRAMLAKKLDKVFLSSIVFTGIILL